jgi:hypothetical protein
MPGETEGSIGWTVDTLRVYFIRELEAQAAVVAAMKNANDRLLAEMDLRYQQRYDSSDKALSAALLAAEKAVQTALLAAKEAVLKAEVAAERRFEAVNEFRGQLADQASSFMPRNEHVVEMAGVDARITRLDETIKAMQIWQGNITGRIAILGAVFAVLMTVIVFAANYATRST